MQAQRLRLLIVLLAGCCFAGSAFGQLAELGLNPLRLEIGARPLGFGGAFTGLADDVNTALYNPGGLAWAKGISLTLKGFEDIVALQAYPTGFGSSLGLAVINQRLTDIPDPLGGVANSNSNIVLLAYGSKLNFIPALYNRDEAFQRMGVGFSLKGLLGETLRRTTQRDRSASGWDMDLGWLWKYKDWWSVGATAQNILPAKMLGGGEIRWDVGGVEGIPSTLKFGTAARVIGDLGAPLVLEGRELTLGGELDLVNGSGALLRLGGEWGVNKTYYFRTGIMGQSKPGGSAYNLNFGCGYRTEAWGIDLVAAHEPLRDEGIFYFSALYFPKDWIVLKQLDLDRPGLLLEEAFEKFSLADNIVTYEDKIEIFGQVKPGVEVYINGLRAATAADNTFRVMVPLKLEKNLIIVEARYEGDKKTWTYKVLRQAKVNLAGEKELKQQLDRAKSEAEKEALKKKQQEMAQKKKKVEELVTLGVIEVTAEAEFRLDASITRGELATWLAKSTGLPLPKVDRDLFSDVKRDDPRAPYIKLVLDWDLLRGFPDGTFRPNAPVSKEEGDKLFRVLKVQK
ncbi:MAG: S-layer homology domain-containing protein [Candidatus Margulisiibacteriota bacterium]